MSRNRKVQNAYALVGEIISSCTEIEIELLYIALLLSENAQSVNQSWHRLSAFRQRIDLTDVVVELMNAKNETRRFWMSLRKALLELNSLRNHIAHGALLDDDDAPEQIHVLKFYEDKSAKAVSLEDMVELRALMLEALDVARWFHGFLGSYGRASLLEEAEERVAGIKKRARALKDKQSRNVPGDRLKEQLRGRKLDPSETPAVEEVEPEPPSAPAEPNSFEQAMQLALQDTVEATIRDAIRDKITETVKSAELSERSAAREEVALSSPMASVAPEAAPEPVPARREPGSGVTPPSERDAGAVPFFLRPPRKKPFGAP